MRSLSFGAGGASLALSIKDTGASSWILPIRIGGKRHDIGLGKRAEHATLKADRGHTRTFEQCTDAFLKRKSAEFSSAKHAARWRTTIETYANPVIGNRAPCLVVTGPCSR
ncbi:MAG: phage integrase central domain-containing protein [Pseudomonadales bacterium]